MPTSLRIGVGLEQIPGDWKVRCVRLASTQVRGCLRSMDLVVTILRIDSCARSEPASVFDLRDRLFTLDTRLIVRC